MKQYTVEKPLLAKHFASEFRSHVRYSVSRQARATPEIGYQLYAEKYGLDYDYVCKLATIETDIDRKVLDLMGLEIKQLAVQCDKCRHAETELVFISR